MKPSFHHRLVGGPYEDPALYVRLFRESRALLFDCGDLRELSLAEVLKISDVFITHTHIDHFIGFDTLLRSQLSHDKTLRVYGPEDIAGFVEGKLRGYAWNLIRDYPLAMEVYAISASGIVKTTYRASESFQRREAGTTPLDVHGTILREPQLKARALPLTHEIPSLGFRIEEDFHINVDKAALERMGLGSGPWLRDLKDAIRRELPDDTMISTEDGGSLKLGDLRNAIMISEGQKITYIADTTPTEDNIARITEFATGSTTLYCEAYFMEADRDRAIERNHLTSTMAGQIGRNSGSRQLIPFHFAPKYQSAEVSPRDEALREFQNRP